jgi:hypothetical protein
MNSNKLFDYTQHDTFIAAIITSWHLDNLIAYLNTYEPGKKGILIILPQFRNSEKLIFRLEKEQIKNFEETYFTEVIFHSDTKFSFNFLWPFLYLFKQKKESLKIISPGNINFRLLSNLCRLHKKHEYIIIDEGIGAYLPGKDFEIIKTKSEGEKKTRNFYKLKNLLISKYTNSIENFKIFHPVADKLVPNKPILNALEKYYQTQAHESSHTKLIVLFKDFGVIDFQHTKELYRYFFDFIKANKFTLIIKKHPNDIDRNFDDFVSAYPNITVIQNLISGEQLVANCRPDSIIGGFSTVLFSSAAIFNIRTLSFMLLYKQMDGISDEHKRIIDWFYSRFDQQLKSMKFVSTKEEIIETLSKPNEC